MKAFYGRVLVLALALSALLAAGQVQAETVGMANDPAVYAVVYREGDAGQGVKDMKKRLQALGYFSRDTVMGMEYTAATAERVGRFQAQNGLRETGDVDERTLALIFSDTAVTANATAKPALSALYGDGEELPVDEDKVEAAARLALGIFFPLVEDGE